MLQQVRAPVLYLQKNFIWWDEDKNAYLKIKVSLQQYTTVA